VLGTKPICTKIPSKLTTCSSPGIFAAGDVTDQKNKQIIISMGAGANAALNAFDYIDQ
jgi:alkyl hydroperoxide reductase subunit F